MDKDNLAVYHVAHTVPVKMIKPLTYITIQV